MTMSSYYTWRRITIAEEDLKVTQANLSVAQESQITERFTRAVDQLGAFNQSGNPAIEIRLGGIYSLDRIANESDEYYWPIMEILTAYVRKNSPVSLADEPFKTKDDLDETVTYHSCRGRISFDIQAILTVIGSHAYRYDEAFNYLDLQGTFLRKANLVDANLMDANLKGSNLEGADLENANLSRANLSEANLSLANIFWANLERAQGLSLDQLSKVKTLYGATLDEELLIPLKEKCPALFDEPKK